jgi:predicted dehydrogenase
MQHNDTIGVGIIGLGVRGLYSIARLMAEDFPQTGFEITALCDRNPQRIRETLGVLQERYQAHQVEIDPACYEDGLALIADPDVDLIIITSITDTHRAFAIPALESGKWVYCDKPLAHNVEDAVAIVEAEARTQNPLIMGFTRRYETAWRKAYRLLQDGAIGDLIMLQVRDIIPYHRYLTAWWRRRAWSGGALNDKGCHLFDVFNWFSGSRAVTAHGFGSRSVIQPDPDAPRRCSECDRDCPYRRRSGETAMPVKLDLMPHFGQSWLQEDEEKFMDDVCVYTPGSDLYHNGSIHFRYQNGVIANFFYTIFGPEADDQETLELVGSKGRLILTRHTGELDLVTEYGETHQVYDCRDEHFDDSHFGADLALVRELRRFCDGAPPTVSAQAGLEATRMVMASFISMDAGGRTVAMSEIPNAIL